MSEFVNYNKRSISLPKGCKNLADLLKGRGKQLSIHHPALASPALPQEKYELLTL
jgi:hypothetical protein